MPIFTHPFPPLWDTQSRLLILGTFPSVQSRAQSFYYGHPQNRFWRVLSAVYQAPLPNTIEEKKNFLYAHHIALWDVLKSCSIQGSRDATIRQPVANDLSSLLLCAPIEAIFTNGKKAASLYSRYCMPATGRPAIVLPSTSPANAVYSLEALVTQWRCLLPKS